MIRLKQVTVEQGVTAFFFEYDLAAVTYEKKIDEREIVEKLKSLSALLGRKPTLQDLREIILQIVNEVRKGRQPFLERFDYSQFIGVDLEA